MIIKQPDGQFCVFSSVVDSVTHYDMSEDEIIEMMIAQERHIITEKVHGIIEKINKGEKPYHQFTMTYTDMLETISNVHGKEELNLVKNTIEK